jgi:hypothetical protein
MVASLSALLVGNSAGEGMTAEKLVAVAFRWLHIEHGLRSFHLGRLTSPRALRSGSLAVAEAAVEAAAVAAVPKAEEEKEEEEENGHGGGMDMFRWRRTGRW